MKRLHLIFVLLLMFMLIAPASASYYYNFQEQEQLNGLVAYRSGTNVDYNSVTWIQTTGNNYIAISARSHGGYNLVRASSAEATTYAAATLVSTYESYDAGGYPVIVLFAADGVTELYRFIDYARGGGEGTDVTYPLRYEFAMHDGAAYIYREGVYVENSATLPTNPYYVGFGGYSTRTADHQGFIVWYTANWDDITYAGSQTPKYYLTGAPDASTYVIYKNLMNPADRGFAFKSNATIITIHNMTTSWSRTLLNPTDQTAYTNVSENNNITLQLMSFSNGQVYYTHYTGSTNGSNTVSVPLLETFFTSDAPTGYYTWYMPAYAIYSNIFSYISSGANVAFDKSTYNVGDTAVITYEIIPTYWDTTLYTYKLALGNVYGEFLSNKSISTGGSGTFAYTFTESDTEGVYYAEIIATAKSDGSETLMNYDYANLVKYISVHGNVYDAESASTLSDAFVNITQSAIEWGNVTSASDGSYSTAGSNIWVTGSPITIYASKSGYVSYNYTFSPLQARNMSVDISLVPSSPSFTGLAILGVARDKTYGNPVSGASVTISNSTYSDSRIVTTNSVGYYLCDNSKMCGLTASRLYDIIGSKIGYGNSSTYQTLVVPL